MMTPDPHPMPPFRQRLLAAERSSPTSDALRKELNAMFQRKLSLPRRLFFVLVASVAALSGCLCGYLAVTEPTLPVVARIGLGTGTLFGIAWAVVVGRMSWRGELDPRRDSRQIAVMVWVFTVLMMVFFLIVGMAAEDRLMGLLMTCQGLAFLIGAGVYWVSHRIEQSELLLREKLLQLELRLADVLDNQARDA